MTFFSGDSFSKWIPSKTMPNAPISSHVHTVCFLFFLLFPSMIHLLNVCIFCIHCFSTVQQTMLDFCAAFYILIIPIFSSSKKYKWLTPFSCQPSGNLYAYWRWNFNQCVDQCWSKQLFAGVTHTHIVFGTNILCTFCRSSQVDIYIKVSHGRCSSNRFRKNIYFLYWYTRCHH